MKRFELTKSARLLKRDVFDMRHIFNAHTSSAHPDKMPHPADKWDREKSNRVQGLSCKKRLTNRTYTRGMNRFSFSQAQLRCYVLHSNRSARASSGQSRPTGYKIVSNMITFLQVHLSARCGILSVCAEDVWALKMRLISNTSYMGTKLSVKILRPS